MMTISCGFRRRLMKTFVIYWHLSFLCGSYLNGRYLVKGCDWLGFGFPRRAGKADPRLDDLIQQSGTKLEAISATGGLTPAALNEADVFFTYITAAALSPEESSNLASWLSSGKKTLIVSGISPYASFFKSVFQDDALMDVVECQQSTDTPGSYSIVPGKENKELVQGVDVFDDATYSDYCKLHSDSSFVEVLMTRASTDAILAIADESTGYYNSGSRIIYIGSYRMWSGSSGLAQESFLNNLHKVACHLDVVSSLLLPWQIVKNEENGGDSVSASLSSDANNNALVSITQSFRTTGQPDVGYELFEPDCVTPLGVSTISSGPTLTSDDSSGETIVTSQFDLIVSELENLSNVWTAGSSEGEGTAEICTVASLLSDNTENADVFYMLETVVRVDVSLSANVVMATAMNVDALGAADQATSNAAAADVIACHCDNTATCYNNDDGTAAPPLKQGSLLNVCLTLPQGFATGTVRSMSLSQGENNDVRASTQVIVDGTSVLRSGLTDIVESPEAATTDYILSTMVPIDFFRFKSDETDRSAGLPPIDVTGEVVLGAVEAPTRRARLLLQHSLSSANDRNLNKERTHRGLEFTMQVDVVPSDDSSLPPLMTKTITSAQEETTALYDGSSAVTVQSARRIVMMGTTTFVGFALLAFNLLF